MNVVALECLRCGSRYPPSHYTEDCPRCRPLAPSNLAVVYDAALHTPRAKPDGVSGKDLWRYGDILPVAREESVSLGEGGSPLHRLDRVGRMLGVANLFAKDETRNPTWSFKDRMASIAVSTARKLGAQVIVSSSTGNAGAAAAAYAAKAGLACVVFTVKGVTGPLLTQMRVYGAVVLGVESKADRWTLMQHGVREYGWFPTSPFFAPAVGSNPYGIEGYKTLAYEIAEQLDWQMPDCCVLPVCYGDAMLGMWRGFEDMRAFGWTDRTPRMIAAETYGSLRSALAQGTDALPDITATYATVAKSMSATRATYQTLAVLRRSDGAAVVVDNDAIMEWQRTLAAQEGLYVEPASAAPLAAIAQLRAAGEIKAEHRVVALLTASGLKDPQATAERQDDLPILPADPAAAFARLRELGIVKI